MSAAPGAGEGLDRFRPLLRAGDLDEVILEIDRLADRREWSEIVDLRLACRSAAVDGFQLWPAESWAAYRLVLEADLDVAGAIAVEDVAFTPGPLTEVAAHRATWTDWAPHLPEGPSRAWIAQERVVRGEAVVDEFPDSLVEVPMAPAPWEPTWPVARYRPSGVELDGPPPLRTATVETEERLTDDDESSGGVVALDRLTRRWCQQSGASTTVVGGRGTAPAAIRQLVGGARRLRLGEVDGAEGLALMAWAAASSGRRGRRAGAAVGRVEAFWAAAAMADLVDDWPLGPDDLGDAVSALRWYRWERPDPDAGWAFRIAVEDPDYGLAWAIETIDGPDE